MIEHLMDHPMGLVHVLLALAALLFGTLVLSKRKGDRRHRLLGRGYLVSMLGLNVTALLNKELRFPAPACGGRRLRSAA